MDELKELSPEDREYFGRESARMLGKEIAAN
jgi:hypothetical protein